MGNHYEALVERMKNFLQIEIEQIIFPRTGRGIILLGKAGFLCFICQLVCLFIFFFPLKAVKLVLCKLNNNALITTAEVSFATYLRDTAGKSRRSIQDSDRNRLCKSYSSDTSCDTLPWSYKKDRQNRKVPSFSGSN